MTIKTNFTPEAVGFKQQRSAVNYDHAIVFTMSFIYTAERCILTHHTTCIYLCNSWRGELLTNVLNLLQFRYNPCYLYMCSNILSSMLNRNWILTTTLSKFVNVIVLFKSSQWQTWHIQSLYSTRCTRVNTRLIIPLLLVSRSLCTRSY